MHYHMDFRHKKMEIFNSDFFCSKNIQYKSEKL